MFCKEEDVNYIQKVAENKYSLKVHTNSDDISILRGLSDECCIVSQPLLLRGVDYRG